MIFVYPHAVTRFIERVAPVTREDAKAAILSHERAIRKAAEFRCSTVRLGDGSRLILDGENVVTVLASRHLPPKRAHA